MSSRTLNIILGENLGSVPWWMGFDCVIQNCVLHLTCFMTLRQQQQQQQQQLDIMIINNMCDRLPSWAETEVATQLTKT